MFVGYDLVIRIIKTDLERILLNEDYHGQGSGESTSIAIAFIT